MNRTLAGITGLAVLLGGCCPWANLPRQRVEQLLREKTNHEAFQRIAWEHEFNSSPGASPKSPPARKGAPDWREGEVSVISSKQGGIEYFASEYPGCAAYVIEVMFSDDSGGLLGPIRVYIDPPSREVVGYGLRM